MADIYVSGGEVYCESCRSLNDDGPYPDGGGEADAPQHCGGCGVFLENPLTRRTRRN